MIVTPDRRLRVFISSTLDLTDERAAARRAIESLNLAPVMFEAGARAHPPRALYRAYVEQSDVFVGIYATRYGWIAPGMDISGLEDEYNLSPAMPRLIYIRRGVEREPELTAMLQRVSNDGLSYRYFASAAELETVLENDLVVLLTERFHAASATGQAPERHPAELPAAAGLFLGRDADLAEVRTLLEREDVRLVTIIGPGGIGKTRLALAAGRAVTARFPGGTFFVALASVREPDLVADAIAAALEVGATDGYPPLAAVSDFLRRRQALLVLDNFEHLLTAAPTVTALLAACPHLHVLATSRAPLRLHGEHELSLEPLDVPEPGARSAHAARSSAVQLFIQTARLSRPELRPDDEMVQIVADICRELDGLPLGIELAAAMVRLLSPAVLLERLRAQPMELGGAMRDMPPRHQRLRETIGWSYELLDEAARRMFEDVSCFRGGFTLEQAEAICSGDGEALGHLATLTEHSLLHTDIGVEHGPRFGMLGVIQRFASDRLSARPDHEAVLGRHAEIFRCLAEEVGGANGHDPAVLDRIEVDLDNIRAAFEHSVERGDGAGLATAMGESWWFWWMRGYVQEGRLWVERALSMSDVGGAVRGRALTARAMLALWSGEYQTAVPAFVEARTLALEADDRRTVAYSDIGVGLVTAVTSSVTEGLTLIRNGTALLEAMPDRGRALVGISASAWVQAITRTFSDTTDAMEEHLRRARDAGSAIELGIIESALAQLHLEHGELTAATDLLTASVDHLATARHVGSTILTLEVVAEIGIRAGLLAQAATVLGATAAVRARMGTRVPPAAARRLEALIGALGTVAPAPPAHPPALADAVEAGQALLAELGGSIT